MKKTELLKYMETNFDNSWANFPQGYVCVFRECRTQFEDNLNNVPSLSHTGHSKQHVKWNELIRVLI